MEKDKPSAAMQHSPIRLMERGFIGRAKHNAHAEKHNESIMNMKVKK